MSALGDRRVIVAPMAGGPSTPELVIAAAEAGVLAFLAAGYKTAVALEAEIAAVRNATTGTFGVNVFVPGSPTADPARLAAYVHQLEPEADRLGVTLGAPTWNDDDWHAKTELLVDLALPICSFAFGCPPPSVIHALQARGTEVMVTVTSAAEAAIAESCGVDVLCAQGIEAGAHRGMFTDDDRTDEALPMLSLVAALLDVTHLPVVAAGGVGTPVDVTDALNAGAVAVQAGTAFLRCDESGASTLHKAALVDAEYGETALTRSFTGRRARGLRNRFMIDHADAPAAYPEVHNVTRPLRTAAVQRGDAGGTNLWAGTGHRHARTGPLAEIVDWLSEG